VAPSVPQNPPQLTVLDGYWTGKLTAAETDWLDVQLTSYNLLTEFTTN
jgi:hypothetical protein